MDTKWVDKLNSYIEQGYIRVATHPSLPLKIYNYTPYAQSEGLWDEVTRKCRGLVLDDKYNVVIRCPEKFFNHTEPLAAKIDIENAVLTEKLDGYYISIRNDSQYGLIITSRGSFDNQYVDAVKKFLPDDDLPQDINYFCELCENFLGDETIIVTQHPKPRLVCWGVQDSYGSWIDPEQALWCPAIKTFTIDEAKDYLNGQVEGLVAFDKKTGNRVKIKTEWFIERHRAISQCSKKTLWSIFASGHNVEDYGFPDELNPRIEQWTSELTNEYHYYLDTAGQYYEQVKSLLPKEIAASTLVPEEWKGLVFMIHKLDKALWQNVKKVFTDQD